MQTWRLIPLLEASGAFQMALDAWLLTQHGQGKHPPTLRFYTWNPAAISLGYHQLRWPEHWQSLSWQGHPVDLVRRPTGGRAVLHYGDLTYTVVTSGLKGSRMQVYQTICEFLLEGWRSLGVDLHYGQAGRGYIKNPNCFGTATSADLVMKDGAKLIGSAQAYQKNAVLQHGSIQLGPDPDLFMQVFGVEHPSVNLPLQQTGKALIGIVMNALVEAAGRCFAANFQIQPLSRTEWHRISCYRNSLKFQISPLVAHEG
ncbi:MAG: lipoate--protein ligase family protein [Leptolyngbyaceae cyanobacterium HOT.MB2.61]|jgi:lipoate-protein ligase A|nr:lipoate--protein ligase family protein [Leptolyngbyaceae cyanobacterium HOT.MB2.61]